MKKADTLTSDALIPEQSTSAIAVKKRRKRIQPEKMITVGTVAAIMVLWYVVTALGLVSPMLLPSRVKRQPTPLAARWPQQD